MSHITNLRVHPSIKKFFRADRFRNAFRNPWERAKVALLPIEYQKFYTEWMDSEERETPVHWIPKEGNWERDPESGVVTPVQNVPVHLVYPLEMHQGLWGGEGVVIGQVKKGKWRTPVPYFWSPSLKRSIVYSEILDKYLSVVVTERALRLIDDSHGLDNYLMFTPAYDLKSLLALRLKRKIMFSLLDNDFCHKNRQRQKELLDKYDDFVLPRNEALWYGLSVDEALEQQKQLKEAGFNTTPLKVIYRRELFEEFKQQIESPPEDNTAVGQTKTWISKLNPFSRSEKTEGASS